MSVLAIIPARGGSKRIPKKNIKDFLGKPIIAYSIEAALESNIFDEVMVSTDSSEIANVSRLYNASVPFVRSKQNSSDFATTEDVLIEVIEQYKQCGRFFDVVCCIYSTAPFVTSKKLIDAYNLLIQNSEADSVIPVVRYSFPPQRAMISRGGFVEYHYPEFSKTRSQDLEPIYHDCGQFYFCKTDSLLKYRDLICPKSLAFELSDEEVQDIDNISDWNIAQIKYQLMNKERI